ncbi:GTP-binding protein [Herbidospora sp. NBRC 101105]|uniref:sulfate adenylyltransferase subunit 1 n=1 Tax=Herbidospora sp. NBRC 101105 TaxID=3032195 RepID=UPI0024A3DD61|nr:GTP-binding protein [Herbidospora sp. NBRC 101105]GLX97683.1 sulfate adenylyltransferase subunit 1 [Herbidospora sp. NBRC 101105]
MSTLLRLATAGSVDDGKSTLVGRLLHDSKSVMSDQLEKIASPSDLALLTDGLRAEREQGITIDVAYRYFATPRRRFVLADTPGHVQYTRNMVTGASTAQLVVLVVDARKGVTEQTRRHAAVAGLLRVPALVLAVNKMDLVGWSEEVFASIAGDLDYPGEVTAIPISALTGDNVVTPSEHMGWYTGPTVLEFLETAEAGEDLTGLPARLPVQYVIKTRGRRAYAGQLTGGILHVGERVVVQPGGHTTTVAGIDVLGQPVAMAWAPQSIAVRLADDLDVARGALISPEATAPEATRELRATVCHLHEKALTVGEKVLVKHTTRTVRAVVEHIGSGGPLAVNDIGDVVVRTASDLAVDDYADSRITGACLLIDPGDGATRSAGMISVA